MHRDVKTDVTASNAINCTVIVATDYYWRTNDRRRTFVVESSEKYLRLEIDIDLLLMWTSSAVKRDTKWFHNSRILSSLSILTCSVNLHDNDVFSDIITDIVIINRYCACQIEVGCRYFNKL